MVATVKGMLVEVGAVERKDQYGRPYDEPFCVLYSGMAIPAFAEEPVTENPVSQISSAFSNVTGIIKISNVVSVIGIVLATAFGFVLFWWGLRKVIKVIMSAFSKGKVRV